MNNPTMNTPKKQTVIKPETWLFIVTQLFFLLFLYAAANKLLDFEKFKVQLGQSPILTDYAGIIAWVIPGIEILISILLVFQRTLMLGLFASLSLMIMFTSYILVILNFAERVPCSCGGILEKMGWTEHLIFNIAFVLIAIVGIILQTKLSKDKK
jgi:uncharacterized membrane protein YphA (DoxX/SURF4 family)